MRWASLIVFLGITLTILLGITLANGLRPPCGNYGDVDFDGYITARDKLWVLEFEAKLRAFSPEQIERADVNDNPSTASVASDVNSIDALFIGQYVKGMINIFPACSLPDIFIKNIAPTGPLTAGNSIRFTAAIQSENNRVAINKIFGTSFRLDINSNTYATENVFLGAPPTEGSQLPLASGATIIEQSDLWTASPGTHALRVCTDWINQVDESDEADNCKDFIFTVTAATTTLPACKNECPAWGVKECVNNGFRVCGNFDSDVCFEWSDIAFCPASTTCNLGKCIPISTTTTFPTTTTTLKPTTSTTTTIQSTTTTTFSTSTTTTVPSSTTTTIASTTTTVPSCVDECTNERFCTNDFAYKVCGNFDEDSCLELGLIGCGKGEMCSNGFCVLATYSGCVNECSSWNIKQCSGNGYQVCGNWDSDSCFEWSSITACSNTCSYGRCI